MQFYATNVSLWRSWAERNFVNNGLLQWVMFRIRRELQIWAQATYIGRDSNLLQAWRAASLFEQSPLNWERLPESDASNGHYLLCQVFRAERVAERQCEFQYGWRVCWSRGRGRTIVWTVLAHTKRPKLIKSIKTSQVGIPTQPEQSEQKCGSAIKFWLWKHATVGYLAICKFWFCFVIAKW